jgi:hypothetical protein
MKKIFFENFRFLCQSAFRQLLQFLYNGHLRRKFKEVHPDRILRIIINRKIETEELENNY